MPTRGKHEESKHADAECGCGPMSLRLLMRGWTLAIALVATGALAAAANASADTGPLVWGSPVTYATVDPTGGGTLFVSIACPSDGNCVAAGYNETESGGQVTVPVFAVETGGVWGPAITITSTDLPGDASSSATANAGLNSISCSSTTSCVAAGFYTNFGNGTEAMVVPITIGGGTGVAGPAAEITPPTEPASDSDHVAMLNSISCSPDGCAAVGEYADSSGNTEPMLAVAGVDGTWTASEVSTTQLTPAPDGDIGLTSISCPVSGGACEAVGNYDSSGDNYPWAVQISGGGAETAQNITMPADNVPLASMPVAFLTANGVSQVSCPTAGACTAAGSYPSSGGTLNDYAVPITGGTPGTVVTVNTPPTEVLSFVDGLYCSDNGDCVLAGLTLNEASGSETFTSFYATETSGVWAPPSSFSSRLDSIVITLGCSSGTNCAAYGEDALGESTFFMSSSSPLSILTSSLPTATVGVPYSATVQAAGGAGTSDWSVSSGTLPAGLSLNAATGVLSGTPTTSGNDGFVVTDTVSGPPPQTATAGVSINVAAAPASATPTTTTGSTPPPTTTTPVSTPTVTTAAAAVAKLGKVSAKGAKVNAMISCSNAACKGALTLTAIEHLKGKKVTAVTARAKATAAKAKAKPKTKTITLAKASYTVAAGKSEAVTLTLKGGAAKLLTARHALPAKLALTPSGSKKATATKTVTLKPETTKKKKK